VLLVATEILLTAARIRHQFWPKFLLKTNHILP
jgi:hypothetical protein